MRAALVACMALVAAGSAPRAEAAPAPRSATVKLQGASITPLFDATQRFRMKKTVRLRFRVERDSGAKALDGDVLLFLRHGPPVTETQLLVRRVKPGIFEIPFTPEGPGQYAVVALVRGTRTGMITVARLGVPGVADGLVEQPPEADAEARAQKHVTLRFSP